jgi:hypothetical protein
MIFALTDLFRRKKVVFTSNEALFDAVRGLIKQMKAAGQVRAAEELEDGMSCLNGLTDGWGLFLESIDKARKMSGGLAASQKATLEDIRAAVDRIVYRR